MRARRNYNNREAMKDRRKLGSLGEKIAKEHLLGIGYVIRETNFRSREGEIDIVAEKGDYLVFVEVRTRRSRSFGTPEESITASKKERLITLAQRYMESHSDLPPFWRIDVVGVELEGGRVARLEVTENAID